MSVDPNGVFKDGSQRWPAPWKASLISGLNVSWHHIIPHAMMRNAWQTLAVNRDSGRCRAALESYMRLLRIDGPKNWLKVMMSAGLSLDQQETLDKNLTWARWNIIEGPYYRTDDRKDHRSLDEFSAGLTITEWNRQKRIKDLFIGLQIFNAATSGGKFSEDSATGVANVMNTVERSLIAGDVIRFRSEMWSESKRQISDNATPEGVKLWKKRQGTGFFDRATAAR